MQKRIGIFFLSFIVMVGLLVLTTSSSAEKKPLATSPQPPAAKGFAIIELFTSQGCSSCPPADALLGQFATANDPQVIAIAFHVDYWNRLGWKDPFSNPLYSERQREYAAIFNKDGIYTPQAVVNGTRQMVGSDAHKLKAAVAQAKTTVPTVDVNIVSLQQKEKTVQVNYTLSAAAPNAMLQAVLVQQQVQTHIKAGENNGLNITNYQIARDLQSKPATAQGQLQLTFPETKGTGTYKVVVFVQEMDGKITGLAQRNVGEE